MDIYTFKKQLVQAVQPAPLHALISAEQAWLIFKACIQERVDNACCEEFGFSLSVASHWDGAKIHTDENVFQVYFGRLIDANQGQAWQSAEINFYYRYAMNARLRLLMAELDWQDVESAFRYDEEEGIIQRKVEPVFAFADAQGWIWEEIRGLKPAQASFQFNIL